MSEKAVSEFDFPQRFGKYHLLSHLAQGGMGALYLAVTGDRGFERLLCIKMVLPHLADQEYLARFRDEAKIVVQLSHGNLIPVFDAGQVDGKLFLAMDFVKGKDLRAVWNRCATKAVAFPIDVAVHIAKELCRGLGYAHGFGDIQLVHRDVSPPNVLISYDGDVKLTDFGLASSTLKTEKTLPGIIYGKVAYMSPEQARGEALDGRSDVYACGIILWELLTGRQLFPPGKEQPQDLLARARDANVMSASERAPRVSRELDAIVAKALASDPDDRYQTADEFRDALGRWLAVFHPTTDVGRIENFIRFLFEEDIETEEADRLALLQNTRERVMTLPPTDELRRLLEQSGPDVRDVIDKAADRRQDDKQSDELGQAKRRRAPDLGKEASDRRGARGRRLVDSIDGTMPGIASAGFTSVHPGSEEIANVLPGYGPGRAVEVPQPGPDGSTAVAQSVGPMAAAVKELEANTSSSELMGQVLNSRYMVGRLIGEGGMGRVYEAEHVDIGKKVAIKILHPVYGRLPDLVERFRREARAASKIGHPNIVDVTDSGTTDDGSVYFVMEYLDGVELAGVIDRQGAIDIPRVIHITVQVCRALSAAHAAGIIHRDLKPENIFLTAREGTSDFVKVVDFGIAKNSEAEEARVKKLTSPGMAMGTPEYMAPEQAAGKIADERCDVYALGAIVYEMLTGAPPYEGANFLEILTKKATTEPTPPRELRSEIPESLNGLLMRVMARNPDERPPSMDAFEYELTKCFAGRGAAVANILGIAPDDALGSGATRAITRDGDERPFTGYRIASRVATSGIEDWADLQTSGREESTGVLARDGSNDESLYSELGSGHRFAGWIAGGILSVSIGVAVLLLSRNDYSNGDGNQKFTAQDSSRQTGELWAKPVDSNLPAPDVATNNPRPERADKTMSPHQPAVDVSSRTVDSGGSNQKPGTPDELLVATSVDSGGSNQKPGTSDELLVATSVKNEYEAQRLLDTADKNLSGLRLKEARRQYTTVVRSTYLKSRAALGLANVSFQQKKYDESIKYARQAGPSERARLALANAYFKKGLHQEAITIYEEVLVKNPSSKSAQSGRDAAKKKFSSQ